MEAHPYSSLTVRFTRDCPVGRLMVRKSIRGVAPARRQHQVYVVSSQGGTPRLLLPGEGGPETDANWSPDGSIVFSTSREAGDDPKSVICILELDGNHVTTLPESVGMYSPRWSPDGHAIVTRNQKSLGLNIFDIKTKRWSTPYKGPVGFPRWSRDSHSIYVLRFQDNPACASSSSQWWKCRAHRRFEGRSLYGILLGMAWAGSHRRTTIAARCRNKRCLRPCARTEIKRLGNS